MTMRLTYDADADAAYVTIGEQLKAGESTQQVALIDTPNRETQITLDFDGDGRLLGIEILGASRGLRPAILRDAEPPGELHVPSTES